MKLILRLAALAVILVLLVLMIGPFGALEQATGVSDKIGHLVGFLAIALCIEILFPGRPRWQACAAALIVGAAVELVQSQVGRDASWGDLLADLAGVVLAYVVSPLLAPVLEWERRPD